MTKKPDDQDPRPEDAAADAARRMKDSASQIWLAGLGAFAKAQEEGSKVFDALVREGSEIQRKTQSAAESRFAEAASRMSAVAGEVTAKASGQWDRLETLFEDRVAKALSGLGVPSARELQALQARVDGLEAQVARLMAARRPSAAAAPAKRSPRTRAAGSTAKPSARRPSSRSGE